MVAAVPAAAGGTDSKGGEDSSGGSISSGGTKVTGGNRRCFRSGEHGRPGVRHPGGLRRRSSRLTSLGFDDVTIERWTTGQRTYTLRPVTELRRSRRKIFWISRSTLPDSYNGDQTGTFEINGGADASYVTCSRCLIGLRRRRSRPQLFAMGGTIAVASDSDHMMVGYPNITLTDVTFVESVILLESYYTRRLRSRTRVASTSRARS